MDLMREAMTAIRNISGALRAWDLRPNAERLEAIFVISDALYTLDARSEVTVDLVRETLQAVRETHPELGLMLPRAYEWAGSKSPPGQTAEILPEG